MKATLATYMERIAALPANDAMEVIRRFGDARLGDGHWAPTPGDICREVRVILERRSEAERARRARERRDAEIAIQLENRKRISRQFENRTEEQRAIVKSIVDDFKARQARDWLSRHANGEGLGQVFSVSGELLATLLDLGAPESRDLRRDPAGNEGCADE
jgi:hypothetical protein